MSEDLRAKIESAVSFGGGVTYDQNILAQAKCVSASKDETVFSLTVTPDLCNPLGAMHGGALATAIDLFTSAAIIPSSKDGFWEIPGVSRTLSVTYLRPAAVQSTVLFKCKVLSLGRRSAALECSVIDAKSMKLLAVGMHDKVNIDKPKAKL